MEHDRHTRLSFALAIVLAWPALSLARPPHDAVSQAIARAVAGEVGATTVRVEVLSVSGTVTATAPLVAAAEPGARSGRGTRFILRSGARRVGSAIARVEVTAPHVVALRALTREDVIDTGDVASVDGPVHDLPLRRLPQLEDVLGTQPRRAIAAGEVVTAALVAVPPVVRSGDEVMVTVRAGAVVASGKGRASGSGHVGDEIRVTRPGSRELRRARITGPGAVEILQ